MNYTVEWRPAALDALAELWMAADDRAAVTEASEEIDRALARDPYSIGESRGGSTRLAFQPPLAVLYVVDDATRTVRVGRCGASRRSS